MPTSDHIRGTGAVRALEQRLAAHFGARHALCVSNATLGLFAVVKALGLSGAEFVTTPYSYGASLAGWLWLGARPRFCDIDPATLTLDPDAARRIITRKTRAILAVDIYGIPADMVALRKLADAHGLWYVADAAQSLGATRSGRPASALADAIVVSFTVGKPISASEGGAIVTDHAALYEKLLWYTQHPERQRRELGLYLTNEFALNARIHPAAAEMALARFDEALRELCKRQRRCLALIDRLNETKLVEPIPFRERRITPSFFRLTAAWKGAPRGAELRRVLDGVRIGDAPAKLLYDHAAFRLEYGRLLARPPKCPRAEAQARRRFCLFPEDKHNEPSP